MYIALCSRALFRQLIHPVAGLLGYEGDCLSSLLLGDFAAPGGLAKCSISQIGQAHLQSALATRTQDLPSSLFELPHHGLYGEGDRLSRELLRGGINPNEQNARVRGLDMIRAARNGLQ